jgi:hypothetical protein
MQSKIGITIKAGDADYNAETRGSIENDKSSFFVTRRIQTLLQHNYQQDIYDEMKAQLSGTAVLSISS